MTTIKFNNYGLTNIFDLIAKYDGKESLEEKVTALKNDMFDNCANSPFMQCSTIGDKLHIVNVETLDNCEILC